MPHCNLLVHSYELRSATYVRSTTLRKCVICCPHHTNHLSLFPQRRTSFAATGTCYPPSQRHSATMHLPLLAAALTALQLAAAHNIALPAHGLECFHENLHHDDTMTVTFQVGDREFGSAGNLDIDFWVRASGHQPRRGLGLSVQGDALQLTFALASTAHQPLGQLRGQRKVRFQRRPLLHRQERRQVHVLLREPPLGRHEQRGLVQRPRHRLRQRVRDAL